jgi:hypothetical protein
MEPIRIPLEIDETRFDETFKKMKEEVTEKLDAWEKRLNAIAAQLKAIDKEKHWSQRDDEGDGK